MFFLFLIILAKREYSPIIAVDDKKIPTTSNNPAGDITLGVIIGIGTGILFIVITVFYIRFLKKRSETPTSSSPDANSATTPNSRSIGYLHSLGTVIHF